MGCTGVYNCFTQNIDCGYSLEPPRRTTICFLAKIYIKKIEDACTDPEIFMREGPTKMVIFGHRRMGVQPPKNPEITFFKVKFSNSRGGSGPPVPPSGSTHEMVGFLMRRLILQFYSPKILQFRYNLHVHIFILTCCCLSTILIKSNFCQ